MSEQVNSGNNDVLQPEVGDMGQEIPQQQQSNNLAIQNNNYFTHQVDLSALGKLAAKNQDLADKYLDILKEQAEHSRAMDIEIIAIEKKEQEQRHEDIPYQRTYAFRGQAGSIVIAVLGLVVAIAFGAMSMEKAAMVAITVPVGVLAVNLLGIFNKGQNK